MIYKGVELGILVLFYQNTYNSKYFVLILTDLYQFIHILYHINDLHCVSTIIYNSSRNRQNDRFRVYRYTYTGIIILFYEYQL